MGKKSKKTSFSPAGETGGSASDQLTEEQWDELMISSIRKLNEEEARVVKFRLCKTMNLVAHKEFNLVLSVPITEHVLLKNLNRAIEEGKLTRQRNGTVVSYGIAGEKVGQIDLSSKDSLEEGKILASLVKQLLTIKKNEGKPRGFELEEIIQVFEGSNELIFPEGEEDKGALVERAVVAALKKGCTSGHIRKLDKEYYVTGRRPTDGIGLSLDPFSTQV